MLELNIKFQEEYKRLDALCKDILCSDTGVSEYIRQMEEMDLTNLAIAAEWEKVFRQLKHVRWLRNKLAHEVGTLNSDLCTNADVAWVQYFSNKIISKCDPLTIAKSTKDCRSNSKTTNTQSTSSKTQKENFWTRIVDAIRNLFDVK